MKSSKGLYNEILASLTVSDEVTARLKAENLRILKDVTGLLDAEQIPYVIGYGTLLGAVRHKGYIPWDDDIDIHIHAEDSKRFAEKLSEELGEKYEFISRKTKKFCPFYFYKVSKKGTALVEMENCGYPYVTGLNIDIFPFNNVPNSGFMAKFKKLGHLLSARMASLECDFKYPSKVITDAARDNDELRKYYRMRRTFGFFASILPIRAWTFLEERFNRQKKHTGKLWAGIGNTVFDESTLYDTVNLPFEDTELKAPKDYEKYLHTVYGTDYMTLPPEEKREKHMYVKVEF